MTARPHQVGVVLSGGGVRGAAHIGLLKALRDAGIEVTAVAGASSGSLVAALFAARRSFNQALDVFRDNDMFSWNYLGLVRKPGLLDSERLLSELEDALNHKTFADVSRELHIVATDLLDGSAHFFEEGSLAKAVMASSAYPGVFSPLEIDGKLLTDGGVVNNLPIEPLIGRCDVLIGSFVNPIEIMLPDELQNAFAVSQRAFQISTANPIQQKLKRCDFAVSPAALLDIGIFELKRSDEAYEIGLNAGREVAEKVAERLAHLPPREDEAS